ncbi:MAG: hypothetical protein NTZ64_18140 [Polaromonas sp.]|nr:hypothetical protein [Polaromonas sp.]
MLQRLQRLKNRDVAAKNPYESRLQRLQRLQRANLPIPDSKTPEWG